MGNSTSASHSILLSAGFATLVPSLLIFSAAVTPFQRYPGTSAFVGTFANWSLGIALAASIAVLAFSAFNQHIPASPLLSYGGALYVMGGIAFAALSMTENLPGSTTQAVAIAAAASSGIGSIAICLVWGRIFKQFTLQRALKQLSAGAMGAGLISMLENNLPLEASVFLFAICSIATVLIPWKLNISDSTSGQDSEPALTQKLASFADVATAPALGLLAFAFIMGTMRSIFTYMFDMYIVGLFAASTLIALCAFHKEKRPLAHIAYQRRISLLAVATLALSNISLALCGTSPVNTFMTMLLYTFAAILTLGTLCAIANAAEFSCDLVFSSALILFAAASVAGLACAEFVPASMMEVVSIVVTALYAVATVFIQHMADPDDCDTTSSKNKASQNDRADRCRNIAKNCGLTKRETEILKFLAEGHTGAYIAEALFISPNTARTHVHNIYRKLNVTSREEILQMTKTDS